MEMSVFTKGRILICVHVHKPEACATFMNQIDVLWFRYIITDESNLPANGVNKREQKFAGSIVSIDQNGR